MSLFHSVVAKAKRHRIMTVALMGLAFSVISIRRAPYGIDPSSAQKRAVTGIPTKIYLGSLAQDFMEGEQELDKMELEILRQQKLEQPERTPEQQETQAIPASETILGANIEGKLEMNNREQHEPTSKQNENMHTPVLETSSGASIDGTPELDKAEISNEPKLEQPELPAWKQTENQHNPGSETLSSHIVEGEVVLGKTDILQEPKLEQAQPTSKQQENQPKPASETSLGATLEGKQELDKAEILHQQLDQRQPAIGEHQNQRAPAPQTVSGARDFVFGRRLAYEINPGKVPIANQWRMKGHGYLFTELNLLLAAEGPSHDVQRGQNVVKIWNVHQETENTFDQCHLLTLWVRVTGPEIFAGSPAVVLSTLPNMSCHWEYVFDIQMEGNYEIDVKVLLWNGNAPLEFFPLTAGGKVVEESQCPDAVLDRDPPIELIANSPPPFQNGFLGFKLYSPVMGCCEICRRTKGCIYWKTPPSNFTASFPRNGCQLYYNSSLVKQEDIPMSHMLDEAGIAQQRRRKLAGTTEASGSPRSNNTAMAQFLGCGWSFHFTLDFPCLSGDLDDQVYMVNRTFVVEKPSITSSLNSSQATSKEELPLCQAEHEALVNRDMPSGRWIQEPWPNQTTCPTPYSTDPKETKMFPITAFDPDYPHCWHRDDLRLPRSRCTEANCRLIKASSKWESSTLGQRKEWMGVWRSYNCNYVEFTKDQLQQCITQRNISSIKMSGASIAAMSGEYLKVRLDGVAMSPKQVGSESPSRSVVVNSLKWPHLLWKTSEESWPELLQRLPTVNATTEEHYVMTPMFITSEREPYVQVSRAERFARLAEEILPKKGYKMINTYELSAAFSFDTSGQGDGLHVIGPPMKAVWTKIFHYLCSDVVEGAIA